MGAIKDEHINKRKMYKRKIRSAPERGLNGFYERLYFRRRVAGKMTEYQENVNLPKSIENYLENLEPQKKEILSLCHTRYSGDFQKTAIHYGNIDRFLDSLSKIEQKILPGALVMRDDYFKGQWEYVLDHYKAHISYVKNLSEEELMLLTLRNELYEGEWDNFKQDLKERLKGEKKISKLVNRIEEDIARIECLRKYEEEQKTNLANFSSELGDSFESEVGTLVKKAKKFEEKQEINLAQFVKERSIHKIKALLRTYQDEVRELEAMKERADRNGIDFFELYSNI